MMMRTLITAAAVTAALTAPSFAQTRTQVAPHRPDLSGYGSYGTYGPETRSRNVYSDRGVYVGRDPDPRIRQQLRRDPTQGD
jgi:hypothetical protein